MGVCGRFACTRTCIIVFVHTKCSPPKGCETLKSAEEVSGLGFKVQGSGFRVQGSEFKVQDSEFRVERSGSGFGGSEFRVQSSRFRVQSSGIKVGGLVGRGGVQLVDFPGRFILGFRFHFLASGLELSCRFGAEREWEGGRKRERKKTECVCVRERDRVCV